MLPLIFLAIAAVAAGAIVVVSVRGRRSAGFSIEPDAPVEPVLPQHVRRQPPVAEAEAYDAVKWPDATVKPDKLEPGDPAWDERKAAFGPKHLPTPSLPPNQAQAERPAPETVLPSPFGDVISADAASVPASPPEEPASPVPPPQEPAAPPAPQQAPPPPAPPAPAPPGEPLITPAAKLAAEAAAAKAEGEHQAWLRVPTRRSEAARPAERVRPPEVSPAARSEQELELELGLEPPPEAPEEELPPVPAPISEPRIPKTNTGFDEKLDVFLKQLRTFSD